MESSALVICNGEMPSKKLVQTYLKAEPLIVCADGGADRAMRLGINPDIIIGDLDSITEAARRRFLRVRTIHRRDQNSTDLEKALSLLVKRGIRHVRVLGATGRRPDHALANFSILLKYQRKLAIVFSDAYCDVSVVMRSAEFQANIGDTVSLMPLGRCSGIVTRGLRYPLTNESLALGIREGASNVAVATRVSIQVGRGALLLFKMRTNSLR